MIRDFLDAVDAALTLGLDQFATPLACLGLGRCVSRSQSTDLYLWVVHHLP